MLATVPFAVTDDPWSMLDGHRAQLALYIGGMGARGKNFYNELAQRYGYEGPAKVIQDLYLSGKKAEAEAAVPDVIVMDLDMPYVDGWAATTSLKRSTQTRHIPVIAMSGISHQARRTAQRAGCDAFVAKPCLPDLLWWRIQAILRKRRP